MEEKNLSVVIPNYKGKELLKKYLPSVLEASRCYSLGKTELIIVDDASFDGSVDYIKSNFPEIRLIEHVRNRGFSLSANDGVLSAKNRIVVLLNNDVWVSRDFFDFLPGHFEDKAVFAVRPCIKSAKEDPKKPRIGGKFRFGFVLVPLEKREDLTFSFFAGGGASAFDREKFCQLGGFDEIFSPFYFEDMDLSYRSWKRGWKIIYEPASLAHHQGGATIDNLCPRRQIVKIAERNKYFFLWKNITDSRLFAQHLFFLPARLMAHLVQGQIASLSGFFSALKQIKPIIKKRKLEKEFSRLRDSEVFSLFKE